MTDKPQHMTGQRAAQILADILKWRLGDWTPVEQISAIRYDQDVVQGSDGGHLPFHMDQILSTPWTEGGTGVRNAEDVDKALRFWNPWMSYWTGEQSVFRQSPGAFYLQQLQENPVFKTINDWDDDDQNAWDEFTEDLEALHRNIARATGHAPRNRGLCPRCKSGNMLSEPGKHGYNDEAECNNSKCGVVIHYEPDEAPNSVRAALRDEHVNDETWLTLAQLREVWPRIKKSTMSKWARAGKVRRNGHNAYNLADTNRMQNTKSVVS